MSPKGLPVGPLCEGCGTTHSRSYRLVPGAETPAAAVQRATIDPPFKDEFLTANSINAGVKRKSFLDHSICATGELELEISDQWVVVPESVFKETAKVSPTEVNAAIDDVMNSHGETSRGVICLDPRQPLTVIRRIYRTKVSDQEVTMPIEYHLRKAQALETFKWKCKKYDAKFPKALRNCTKTEPLSLQQWIAIGKRYIKDKEANLKAAADGTPAVEDEDSKADGDEFDGAVSAVGLAPALDDEDDKKKGKKKVKKTNYQQLPASLLRDRDRDTPREEDDDGIVDLDSSNQKPVDGITYHTERNSYYLLMEGKEATPTTMAQMKRFEKSLVEKKDKDFMAIFSTKIH